METEELIKEIEECVINLACEVNEDNCHIIRDAARLLTTWREMLKEEKS